MTEMRRVFLLAAELIEQRGYFRGDFYPEALRSDESWPFRERPLSVYGAIRMAVGGRELAGEDALPFLREAVRLLCPLTPGPSPDLDLQAWEEQADVDHESAVRALWSLADVHMEVAA